MPHKITEKDIQNTILEYLSLVRIFAWRNNSGVIFTNGYAHRMGPKGSPDIMGVMPDGRFLGIEVKKPGGITSNVQKEFLEKINNNKGLAFVAYSVDDVIEKLKNG